MYIVLGLIGGFIIIAFLLNIYDIRVIAPRQKLETEVAKHKAEIFKLKTVVTKFEKVISVSQGEVSKSEKVISELLDEISKSEKIISELQGEVFKRGNTIYGHRMEIESLIKGINEKDELFNNLKLRDNESVSKITSLYSDFLLIQCDISSRYLETKSHPAKMEVLRIKELIRRTKPYIFQYRQMLYKYEILLQLFPELSNYVDDFDSIKDLEDIKSLETLQEDYDRVQLYVSKEEYSKLSTNERNQLALDRYMQGQKSRWEIGRDYELYCGLMYEEDNWEVEYIGMEKKLYDMGRDLIAIKGNIHHVVQCKYWSSDKMIHEKHITHLFGTTVEYGMNFPESIIIKPVFITNIQFSESANRFAEKLGVIIKENIPLKEFPRIKCNVNCDANGFKTLIYHLPFDQQYDRTKINKEGEFFAYTVDEAVQAGFRRAFRYFG